MKHTTALTIFLPMIVLLIFGIYVAYSSSLVYGPNSAVNAVVISSSGLNLTLSINDNSIFAGDGIAIWVSESNTQATPLNITASDDWYVSGLALNDCGKGSSPIGIGVSPGYYSLANVSAASFLDIFENTHGCLSIAGPSYFVFQPHSSIAAWVWNSTFAFGPVNRSVAASITTDSYCCANSSVGPRVAFQPGTYTVVGGDEWGNLAILHFDVAA